MTEVQYARFISKISIPRDSECWIWTGAIAHKRGGYGVFRLDDKVVRASRLAYETWIGTLPSDLFALHSCDNPPCVNPLHLEAGTHEKNMADAASRDRMASGDRNGLRRHPERCPARLYPEAVRRGESHGMARLTEEKVRRVFALKAQGLTQEAIASELGISQSNVSVVLLRHTWKHVTID